MKHLLFISVFLLVSCTFYDHKIENLPCKELSYKDLPVHVQEYMSNVSYGFGREIMFIDDADSTTYRIESVPAVIGPWNSCYKLINVKKNIVYRIEQGTSFPLIIDKDKLYIPDVFVDFVYDDYKSARYSEYELK
jgi:hypothetical protein